MTRRRRSCDVLIAGLLALLLALDFSMPRLAAMPAGIEDEHDRAVAEDGVAAEDLEVRERGAERLDDDFLDVGDAVDDDAEGVGADAHDDGELLAVGARLGGR